MSLIKLREEAIAQGNVIGQVLPNQHWVELNGRFTFATLMSLAAEIQKQSKGTKNVNKK
jgi:hypothetical protein